MPAFFVPAARDPAHAEEVYASIVAFVEAQGFPVSPERLYALSYTHNGRNLVDRVGEVNAHTGEVVVAIFRPADQARPYYVCTANRGVLRGEPVLVDGSWQTTAIGFSAE